MAVNLTRILVVGTFVDSEADPLVGKIRFTPSFDVLLDPDENAIVDNTPITATLDVNGSFAVELPATNAPDVTPTGWTWKVEEPTGRVYNIPLPYTTPGGVLDLVDAAASGVALPGTTVVLRGALVRSEDWDNTTPPSDGQVPVWHQDVQKWRPGTVAGGGGGADATTSTKGVARILGGTADAPTVPATAITGVLDDARIPSGITRDSELSAAISAVIAGAPGALDTLDELAAAFGDDANFAATVTTALAAKASTSALTAEVSRATAAEGVNATALAGLPFRAANTDVTGAAVGQLLAATTVSPLGTAFRKPAALDLASRAETKKRLRPSYFGEAPPYLPLYPPPAVDVTQVGTAGSSNVNGYRISSVNGSGESIPCAVSNTYVPDTLNGSNYLRCDWGAVAGAESYNVYRNGVKIGNTTSTTFNDTGQAASGAAPVTRLGVANRGPTITDVGGSSTITNSVLVGAASTTAFTYLGTVPGLGSGATAAAYLTNPSGAPTNSASGERNPWAVEFDYDGSAFEIVDVVVEGGTVVRVMVNGEYMTSTGVPFGAPDNAAHFLKVDFGFPGLRRIRLEMKSTFVFKGIQRQPTATVMASPRSPLRLICFGDSFSQPTFVDNIPGLSSARILPTGHEGWAWQLGALLGIRDTWSSGAGGTGYLATGGGKPTFRGRIADITNFNPDAVLVLGGYNDLSTSLATEAPLFWNALRAALPNAALMAATNFTGGTGKTGYSSIVSNVATPVQSAVTAVGGSYLDLLPLWTGTGYQGATTGLGTSDVLVGTDGIHPTFAGHRSIARYLAMLIDQAGALA